MSENLTFELLEEARREIAARKQHNEEWDDDGPVFTYAKNFYHPENCPACIVQVTHLHSESAPPNRPEYVEATRQRYPECAASYDRRNAAWLGFVLNLPPSLAAPQDREGPSDV